MSQYFRKGHEKWLYRVLSVFIVISFGFTSIIPPSLAQTILNLPVPGTMVTATPAFSPIVIKGLMIHPQDALKFDFIIDEGDQKFSEDEFRNESTRLIKYFLTALTVPEKQMWVNLSPYEKDRIIPQDFGKTEMGRDLLAQDYLLKQLTASLMYPEKELGSEFWTRVHEKAKERFGTTDIPMNTFNKIWIIPESAEVFENVKGAFIVKNHLKVMLEEDYLALEANKNSNEHGLGDAKTEDLKAISGVQSQVIKEILIPEIEREVNEGKTFTQLRQIYNAVILATWYKQALKQSLLGRVYVDQAKTQGIEHEDPAVNQKIYEQYVAAFQKGVYDYMKEDYDAESQQVITQKYFSGGAKLGLKEVGKNNSSAAMLGGALEKGRVVTTKLDGGRVDAALLTLPENMLRDKLKGLIEQVAPFLASDEKVTGIIEQLWQEATELNQQGINFTVDYHREEFDQEPVYAFQVAIDSRTGRQYSVSIIDHYKDVLVKEAYYEVRAVADAAMTVAKLEENPILNRRQFLGVLGAALVAFAVPPFVQAREKRIEFSFSGTPEEMAEFQRKFDLYKKYMDQNNALTVELGGVVDLLNARKNTEAKQVSQRLVEKIDTALKEMKAGEIANLVIEGKGGAIRGQELISNLESLRTDAKKMGANAVYRESSKKVSDLNGKSTEGVGLANQEKYAAAKSKWQEVLDAIPGLIAELEKQRSDLSLVEVKMTENGKVSQVDGTVLIQQVKEIEETVKGYLKQIGDQAMLGEKLRSLTAATMLTALPIVMIASNKSEVQALEDEVQKYSGKAAVGVPSITFKKGKETTLHKGDIVKVQIKSILGEKVVRTTEGEVVEIKGGGETSGQKAYTVIIGNIKGQTKDEKHMYFVLPDVMHLEDVFEVIRSKQPANPAMLATRITDTLAALRLEKDLVEGQSFEFVIDDFLTRLNVDGSTVSREDVESELTSEPGFKNLGSGKWTYTPVGGIDMNPAMLNMKKDREGNGVIIPLPVEPAGNWNNVEGFTPFIINVLPITNLPLLLGIKNNGTDDKTPETEVSYNVSFLATDPRQEAAAE